MTKLPAIDLLTCIAGVLNLISSVRVREDSVGHTPEGKFLNKTRSRLLLSVPVQAEIKGFSYPVPLVLATSDGYN